MDQGDTHEIEGGGLRAHIAAQGAELVSLVHATAGQVLWDAGAAWRRHAPVLFPIVGKVRDDRYRYQGETYRLPQHGFARDRRFDWVERGPDACRLALRDDAETRAVFPFAFHLELSFAVGLQGLQVDYALSNPGDGPLLASLGAHPGFRWPLAAGKAPEDYRIVFAEPEPEPLRRVEGDGLLGGPLPSPVEGDVLPLSHGLFAAGALVFDKPRSRSLRYEADTGPALHFAFEGFEELGVWSPPDGGGDFVCIEPWRGMADPVGFDGDLSEKPGIMTIAPGETVRMGWRAEVRA